MQALDIRRHPSRSRSGRHTDLEHSSRCGAGEGVTRHEDGGSSDQTAGRPGRSDGRKNPRWECDKSKTSNWYCNPACRHCRELKPANPRRPPYDYAGAAGMPRGERRTVPEATKRSDDLKLWAAENESIGHALSMTLRHDAFVMRLECLPMKVDSSEDAW